MTIRTGMHSGFRYFYDTEHFGSHCGECKQDHTPTSIHGSCLECGYQKYPSKYRTSRKRSRTNE